mmetsp:Transcript_6781/g.18953  ORF Transcript_6781/g.18953 Transcript_6781/m.18953 type:complete len:633 (+) Transcript_6781:153-2051(+)
MAEPTTKRARDASTAGNALQDIQQLKRKHHVLFREISKRLNYASDDGAYTGLIENKDLEYLNFSNLAREQLSAYLQFAFFNIGNGLAKSSAPTETDQSPLLKQWNTAFALRAAFLYASLQPVGGSSALECYPALPNPEQFEPLTPVILRQEDKFFWESCMRLSVHQKVCGVGAPGIGKTTTTFHLLKTIIMEKMAPVVYAVQQLSPNKTVYMKFVPIVKDGTVVDITVSCVESDRGPKSALEWQDGNYYVVDPGVTKVSCDVNFDNRVHIILVCSCDDSHWGKNEFTKMRSRGRKLLNNGFDEDVNSAFKRHMQMGHDNGSGRTLGGNFVYCSSWKLKDVIGGKHLLGLSDLTDATICSRYRVTGGSVRKIIAFTSEKQEKKKIENALSKLLDHTVHELADGRCNSAFDASAPESALVSVEPDENAPSEYRLVICSDVAEEIIAVRRLKLSWYALLDEDNSSNRGNLFESFVRHKLSRALELKMDRDSSPFLPPKASKDKKKNYTQSSTVLKFPERTVVRVTNLAESVRNSQSDLLFYSRDESEPLIDMICRFERGFLAIQVTIQPTHTAKAAAIRELLDALNLSDNEKLVIVFATPSNRLKNFKTAPVNPLLEHQDLAEKVEIHHVGITDS